MNLTWPQINALIFAGLIMCFTGILIVVVLIGRHLHTSYRQDTSPGNEMTGVWINDHIRAKIEEDRNESTKDTKKLFFYSPPRLTLFYVGATKIEPGLRSDGVVVWRKEP